MIAYRDWDRDSGIVGYEYGSDWIEVEFRSGAQRFYKYTHVSAGQYHVEQMKILADNGDGLNAYINKHVAKSYETKR